eukprot:12915561-Prorocentrum_lima.AAC.1
MEWADFSNDVRKRLAKGHLAGRRPAPVVPPTMNLVVLGDEDGCNREEWKTWIDCCEDEAFVSAMRLDGGNESE